MSQPGDAESDASDFSKFEETLPEPLKRSSSHIFHPEFGTSVGSTQTPTTAQPTGRAAFYTGLGAPDSPEPSAASARRGQHLNPSVARFLQDQEPENAGRDSPIPMPGPTVRPQIPLPALDKHQASTGVIWTTERAMEKGFTLGDPSWSNLGQGAPEVGDIPGCFQRPAQIDVGFDTREYAPTAGLRELREAVANLYNDHYRQGKSSQYTWENVCIVPGGRAGLTRIAAILKDCYLSFFLPDYTAYAEMLALFKNFAPIPVPLYETDNYRIHLDIVRNELNRGVSALLTSNPRNPTGQCMTSEELEILHDMCRDRCLLIMDEFYSRYNYEMNCSGESLSSASHVEDVDRDSVLILDGLTKAFRLPGWRICWILGPKAYIQALGSVGSYLDGGSNVPFQKAAVPFLDPTLVRQEMRALQTHFKMKRDYCVSRLLSMGFNLKTIPSSTFYIWLDVSHLPGKAGNCLGFFHECLHEKTIVVPGIFFDLNPLARRELKDSAMYSYVRISYGPELEQLVKGMDAIERIVKRYSSVAAVGSPTTQAI